MLSVEVIQKFLLNEQAKVISKPEQALRSKMAAQLRSIQNLEEKKARINFQLKEQKRSLARKREELKKSNRSLNKRLNSESKAGTLSESVNSIRSEIEKIDAHLFLESSRILKD